jgi:hypothetical protein
MNKIVASVGMVAIGASGLQAAAAADFTSEGAKPWSVSATLRGFYDDNVNGTPNGVSTGTAHRDSFGFSISPGATLTWQNVQTAISAAYVLSAMYYQYRPVGETSNWDLDHTFNLKLDHSFNERYRANVTDSFVVGQEPDTLRAGNTLTSFQRLPGSNIRNYGSVTFDATLTPLLGLEAGYANGYYDYAGSGAAPDGTSAPSTAGVLNRIEQTFHLDARWQWRPETTLIAGYQFSETAYIANEVINGSLGGPITGPGQPPLIYSNSRNNRSQYGYVGVDHTFRPDLTGSLRAGGRYNDYYNDPTSQNDPSPYVMATARYTYMTESYVEAGVSYDRSSTDLFSVNTTTGTITTDSQSAAFWASWYHRITPKVYGSLLAQVQNSTYNGGSLDSDTDMYYLLGLTLEYRFTPNFSTQIGYNYDRLDSSSSIQTFTGGRSFDRNRVYLGVTASY